MVPSTPKRVCVCLKLSLMLCCFRSTWCLGLGFQLQPKSMSTTNCYFSVAILVPCQKWDCLLHTIAGIGLQKKKKPQPLPQSALVSAFLVEKSKIRWAIEMSNFYPFKVAPSQLAAHWLGRPGCYRCCVRLVPLVHLFYGGGGGGKSEFPLQCLLKVLCSPT